MSLREEQTGVHFMGLTKSSKTGLLVPVNPLADQINNMKDEREAEDARNLLIELEKQKQADIEAKLAKLELLPMFNKIILLPYPQNPYKKVMQGNIIVDYNGDFANPDTGERDKLRELIGCAKVIEVGPECKYLKEGDDVYYDTRTVYPVPFMSLGYMLCAEQQIMCVLNEGLKERFQI